MQLPKRKPGKYAQTTVDTLLTTEACEARVKERVALLRERKIAASETARLAEFGDFSENVEYQLAKGRLRRINDRLLMLEYQISHATIIEPPASNTTAAAGHTIVVEKVGRDGETYTYRLVGSAEADPAAGNISIHSPLGVALIGRAVGDEVAIRIGNEDVQYVVRRIS